jgi:hypothetical protein
VWLCVLCGVGLAGFLDDYISLVDNDDQYFCWLFGSAWIIFNSGLLGWGCSASFGGGVLFINGEFDPGSGRTLAACLTHASRTVMTGLALSDQWRTGE